MQRFFLLTLFCFVSVIGAAQQSPDTVVRNINDTVLIKDSGRVIDMTNVNDGDLLKHRFTGDSIAPQTSKELLAIPPQQLVWELMMRNEYLRFSLPKNESKGGEEYKKVIGKEWLFYTLVLLLLLFAFLRQAFPKYFNDLFRLFFRTTIKQRQTKEQLMQTPLPSLLLNGFFVLSAGLYCSFLVQHFELAPGLNFWVIYLYACIALAIIYAVKFAGLKIAGWVFNVQETADAYTFIVFIINKMTGILLLPFLLVLAFSVGNMYEAGLLLSLIVTGGLFMYRFILSFGVVRSQARVNPFHFFLYLCAFELAPLLLLYKGLLLFFGITA